MHHSNRLFLLAWSKSFWSTVVLTILFLVASTESGAAFELINQRGGNSAVLVRNPAGNPNPYDYGPTVMRDGVYKMWWCGGIAADQILYSEANSLSGPWSEPPISVFKKSDATNAFDGTHTCDPSVIRVNGTYYMYYTGLNTDIGRPNKIGVASSQDGLSWIRLNNGQSIITPQVSDVSVYTNNDNLCDDGRAYGGGQPSTTYVDGYVYLIYTDTTGNNSNPCNGAGQYVVRSHDPTFQTGVEVRTDTGFAPRTILNKTSHSVLQSFSIDWLYSDILDQFIIASDTDTGLDTQPPTPRIDILLYDRSIDEQTAAFSVSAQWREGPGIVKRPDGHALPSPQSLSLVPLDIMRAVGTPAPRTWDLAHVGRDLETFSTLDQLTVNNKVGRVLEGFRLQTSGLPMTLVREGKRLQFQLRSIPLKRYRSKVETVDAAIVL